MMLGAYKNLRPYLCLESQFHFICPLSFPFDSPLLRVCVCVYIYIYIYMYTYILCIPYGTPSPLNSSKVGAQRALSHRGVAREKLGVSERPEPWDLQGLGLRV